MHLHFKLMLLTYGLGMRISGFDSKDLSFPTPVAATFKRDDFCIIKQTVERSFEVIITTEEFKPVIGLLITGKDHTVGAFLFITPVNHVEEHTGGFSVKDAPADFVNNQA